MGHVVTFGLVSIPIWGLAYLLDLHIYLGVRFTSPQYMGFFLALTLALTFLLFPARKKDVTKPLPGYDIALAILAFSAGLYLTLYHPDIVRRHYVPTRLELFLGAMTILLILEAARRATGLTLPLMGCFFIFYVFYADLFPGMLKAKGYYLSEVIPYYYSTESGIPGVALRMGSTIVLAYVLFGQILLDTGGGKIIRDLCLSLVGRFRGGPAKVAIIASALFGSMSGSPGANVVVTGTLTIPMIKGVGYRPHFAAAVEAVSSTGGMVIPPVMGVAAFLMAEFLGISYAKVALTALLPALLYYLGVFVQVDLEAAKTGLRGLDSKDVPQLVPILKGSWPLVLPLASLIYFLLIARITPTTAALYATLATLITGLLRRESRLSPGGLLKALKKTGQGMLDIAVVTAFVGIIIGSLYMTGLGVNFSMVITALAGNNVSLLLLLAAAASIILGMGMPAVACYALLAVLVAPALEELGIDPIAAHMFILYFGAMSFITPPVAPAAIIAAGLAGASYMRAGWQACRLGIVAYLAPFVFVFNPPLLMHGKTLDIVHCFFTACIGVVLLAAGLEGFFLKRINLMERVFLLVGGTGFFVPGWKTDIIGLSIFIYIFFKEGVFLRRLLHLFFRPLPMKLNKPEVESHPSEYITTADQRKK